MLLLGASRAGAQQVDSTCIVLFDQWRQGACVPNPDSAYIDTCIGTSHFGEYYSMRSYELNFEWYVIHSPIYNYDTTLVYDWQAIDTSFPAIRSAFATIDSLVGHFMLEKPYPYITDTSSFLNKDFFLRFDSLLNVDTTMALLSSIPDMARISWRGGPVFEASINWISKNETPAIWPQPCINEFFIRIQNLPDNISFYDPLCRQIKLPIESTNGLLTVDVSNQPNGVLYANVGGQFFKILIQK